MAFYGRKKFEPVSTAQPRMGDLTVSDYANGVPNIRLGEMFKSLMRQLPWVLILLVLGSFGIYQLTKDMKREYVANGRLLVQLGSEHTYNPVGDQAGGGNGLSQTIDTITLTEAALMKNDEVIAKSIEGIVLVDKPNYSDRFDREGFAKIKAADDAGDALAYNNAIVEQLNSVASRYAVAPHPKASIIDVAFRHEDPEVAVDMLRLLIDEYKEKRKGVFNERSSQLITERREATEEQLKSNERAIASFLKKNNIGNFESEQEGLQERSEDLKASLNETRASIAEVEAALAEIEDQLRGTPKTIDLFVDDRASQRVSQAELELGQLLARYLPNSDPVKQKQTELAELRALQNSYGGKAAGGRRVGPNPNHQTLTERRNEFAATADSLREREFTQQRQLNSADGKVRQLTGLNPTYQNLLRERATLESRLTSYNSKEQEALVDAQQISEQSENIAEVSVNTRATKGRDTAKWAWFGGTAAWGMVLFFLAMIRVFLDPRLYAPAASRVVPAQQMAVADVEPMHAPIPEAVPMHEPELPTYAPNPYEAQPAEYAALDSVAPQVPEATQVPVGSYDQSNYVHYSQTGDVYAAAAPLQAEPIAEAYVADPYAPNPYVGNTAVDLNHNPYAAGQIQAGSLEPQPQQQQPMPNPYLPPQS